MTATLPAKIRGSSREATDRIRREPVPAVAVDRDRPTTVRHGPL